MNEKEIPTIPIPAEVRWQIFRTYILPPLFFLGLCTGIAFIWKDHVQPVVVPGEMARIEFSVNAPLHGTILDLHVEPRQRVEAGQIIATILPHEARLAEARLAIIQSEIHLLTVGMDPLLSRRRVEYDHQRLAVEAMKQRVEIATAKINLVNAEAMYERALRLQKQGAGSIAELERSQALRDGLLADIAGREKLLSDLVQGLSDLALKDPSTQESPNPQNRPKEGDSDPVMAAIQLQQENLKLVEAEHAPVIVRAPATGFTGELLKRKSENTQAGETILTITSLESPHIVTYIRHPIAFNPTIGMQAEVIQRTNPRKKGSTVVVDVSPHFLEIPASLSGSAFSSARGLPVYLRPPSGMALRPGELVDIRLLPARSANLDHAR